MVICQCCGRGCRGTGARLGGFEPCPNHSADSTLLRGSVQSLCGGGKATGYSGYVRLGTAANPLETARCQHSQGLLMIGVVEPVDSSCQ